MFSSEILAIYLNKYKIIHIFKLNLTVTLKMTSVGSLMNIKFEQIESLKTISAKKYMTVRCLDLK